MDSDVFTIKARRCKVCGRILTSKKAVEEGYGETCKCKAKKLEQEREPIDGQMDVFDFLNMEDKEDETT